MKTKDLLKRIEALEQRIRDLEARPVLQPIYVPAPYPAYPAPVYPPFQPWYVQPSITPQPSPLVPYTITTCWPQPMLAGSSGTLTS
jgi:hypothetical protein